MTLTLFALVVEKLMRAGCGKLVDGIIIYMIRKKIVIYRKLKFKRFWFDPNIHSSVCRGARCKYLYSNSTTDFGCIICSSNKIFSSLGLDDSKRRSHYSYYYVGEENKTLE